MTVKAGRGLEFIPVVFECHLHQLSPCSDAEFVEMLTERSLNRALRNLRPLSNCLVRETFQGKTQQGSIAVRIFVSPVEDVLRIRNGDKGEGAL
jgi:hypothetical protein